MSTADEYITRINNNDTTLTKIDLSYTHLNDSDAGRLMQALIGAPEIAKKITSIDFSNNKLTCINIPDTLTGLHSLDIQRNQLTSITIPALPELRSLHLGFNQLPSIAIPLLPKLEYLKISNNLLTTITIPKSLPELRYLYLGCNQLPTIAIPSSPLLDELDLRFNQLTSITIPELAALTSLDLNNNGLTTIAIPSSPALKYLNLAENLLTSITISELLPELRSLDLNQNQLTNITIPRSLIKLRIVRLMDNPLTAATKLALSVEPMQRIIEIEENIHQNLTPEILREHFEIMKPRFLSTISPSLFKNAVIRSGQRAHGASLPSEHVMMAMSCANIGPEAFLNENIAMLKNAFSSDEPNLAVLNNWLSSPEMIQLKSHILTTQNTAIQSLSNEFKRNLKQASNNINRKTKMLESILNYGGAAAITWKHKPSYGLSDHTPIEPSQNPFQLALKPKI